MNPERKHKHKKRSSTDYSEAIKEVIRVGHESNTLSQVQRAHLRETASWVKKLIDGNPKIPFITSEHFQKIQPFLQTPKGLQALNIKFDGNDSTHYHLQPKPNQTKVYEVVQESDFVKFYPNGKYKNTILNTYDVKGRDLMLLVYPNDILKYQYDTLKTHFLRTKFVAQLLHSQNKVVSHYLRRQSIEALNRLSESLQRYPSSQKLLYLRSVNQQLIVAMQTREQKKMNKLFSKLSIK